MGIEATTFAQFHFALLCFALLLHLVLLTMQSIHRLKEHHCQFCHSSLCHSFTSCCCEETTTRWSTLDSDWFAAFRPLGIIPMGVQVIPIPTEVVPHSLPFPFPILCFIPILMGFLWDSGPIGNPIPMHISTINLLKNVSNRSFSKYGPVHPGFNAYQELE